MGRNVWTSRSGVLGGGGTGAHRDELGHIDRVGRGGPGGDIGYLTLGPRGPDRNAIDPVGDAALAQRHAALGGNDRVLPKRRAIFGAGDATRANGDGVRGGDPDRVLE